ncbi:PAB-dependent poly(A)-specific ribonuclease subunit 3 [Perkinsus olseni]|uniref:PAB-dependent poly(A)-specific ribonuclease subunit 3 n=1 Tax=Perkinsus olseni TaxID=32597 RepID=A0A7J6RLF7_PEROL|nr:PAB-dependent poly(A)-specific ribonuclease subunit 3 [Perkinsus olseni]
MIMKASTDPKDEMTCTLMIDLLERTPPEGYQAGWDWMKKILNDKMAKALQLAGDVGKLKTSSGATRRRKSSGGSSSGGASTAAARPKTVLTRPRDRDQPATPAVPAAAASPPPDYARRALSPLSRSAFPELPPSSSALEKAASSPPPISKQPPSREPCWGPPPPSTTGLASSVWGPPPGMPPPPPPPPGPPPAVPKVSSKPAQSTAVPAAGSGCSVRNAAVMGAGDATTPQSAQQQQQPMDSPQKATGSSPNRPPPPSSSSSSGAPPFVLPSSAVGRGMRPPNRIPRSPIPPVEKPAPLPPYMLERPPPHATSLSADPTIRKELQMHRVNTVLSNRDYPVDSNMPAVPEFVQNKYHTLLSLPEGGSGTRDAVPTAASSDGQQTKGSSSGSSGSVGNGSHFGYQYKTYFYKGLSVADSYVYCLCRVDGFSLSYFDLVTEAVRTWSAIHHPCIVPLRQDFGTRDFIEAENPSQDGGSLVYVYDYIPSVATLQSVFIDSPTLKQNGIGGIPEHVIWDVLSQLIMCLEYIHSHGTLLRLSSAKVIHPTKILVTDTAFLYPPRVYLNCVGLLDALAQACTSALRTQLVVINDM